MISKIFLSGEYIADGRYFLYKVREREKKNYLLKNSN